ncbi:hypothetical protein LB507_006080 [Fusarium sp. FIESC RH6]|nr:hypothetical protein LB507_006080 [Fusarium sp. FIESC RH6]
MSEIHSNNQAASSPEESTIMSDHNSNFQAPSVSGESTVMSDHSNNIQPPVVSEESSTQVPDTPSTSDPESDSESESSNPGHANAPPPYQHPHNHHCHAPHHEDVHFHQWQCCCFSFHPPQSLSDFIEDGTNMQEERTRLLGELHQAKQLLRSYEINQGEFHAVLAEYVAIKHEILKLEIREHCVRRGSISRFDAADQIIFH